VKVRSVKKYIHKFVRIKFLAKGEMSCITGTIIRLQKDCIRLNANDGDEIVKIYYNNIFRITELVRNEIKTIEAKN
jgi:exoribonuclease II